MPLSEPEPKNKARRFLLCTGERVVYQGALVTAETEAA